LAVRAVRGLSKPMQIEGNLVFIGGASQVLDCARGVMQVSRIPAVPRSAPGSREGSCCQEDRRA
jgi:hypothetical protein